MGKKILSSQNDRPKNSSNGGQSGGQNEDNDPDLKQFVGFLRTFILPMIVIKVFLLYFGLNYSQYPGEGYGYGLVATLCVAVGSFSYFLWSQRKRR